MCSPMFVIPLIKPGGYVTYLMQMQLPFTLFTSLEEYRRCALLLFIIHYYYPISLFAINLFI